MSRDGSTGLRPILKRTLGAALLGAAIGAVPALMLCAVILAVLELGSDGSGVFTGWSTFASLALGWAIYGAMLGSILGWTLLRRVPARPAASQCLLGAISGAFLGLFAGELFAFASMLLAAAGALLAAIRLYLKHRRDAVAAS